jgi:SWI/SNF-related matrix-associated actin-dependent regulator of chromatin subfamily A3
MKAFRSFTESKKACHLRLQANMQLASWLQQPSGSGTATTPRYCALDVLVFGYRHEAEIAAAELASQGFYLQDPDGVPPGFSYENPQCLELPPVDIPLHLPSQDPSIPRAQSLTGLEFVHGNPADVDLDILLDTFACHSGLVQASAVAQVSTSLLRCITYTVMTI